MTTENVKTLGGDVAPTLEKGKMAKGTIIRISTGLASDFMTPEQVEARKVLATAKFVEIEVGEPESGVLFTKSFQLYEGTIPENSIMGKLLSMYTELKEDGEVNLITKEVNGRNGAFVVWDIIV